MFDLSKHTKFVWLTNRLKKFVWDLYAHRMVGLASFNSFISDIILHKSAFNVNPFYFSG